MRRQSYFLLGWICVALGTIGAFLPVMPTTVFILVAAWAFARSSPRLHRWLREHPRFGATLIAWEEHRAMPRRAKRIAIAMLAASYTLTAWVLGPLAPWSLATGVCLAAVGVYIVRLPVVEDAQARRR